MNEPAKRLTILEAAKYLGMKPARLYDFVYAGQIEFYDLSRFPGRGRLRIEFSEEQLDRFVESRRRQLNPPAETSVVGAAAAPDPRTLPAPRRGRSKDVILPGSDRYLQ